MLVLARKPSEAIKIGDSIIVKVIAIRGGQVKLGIEAPAGIRVIRTDSHPPAGMHNNAAADTSSGAPPGVAAAHEASAGAASELSPGTSANPPLSPDAQGGNGSSAGSPEERKQPKDQ